jgi:hypothetical protein
MKRILILLALCLGAAGSGFAQSRMVSISDTSGVPGTVLQLPVRVSGVTPSDGVTSAQFTFTFPSSEFDLLGVSLTGTLLEASGSAEYNANLKRVAVATPDTLSGNGVLFYLNLRIRPTATKFGNHVIGFADAMLNEGVPALTTDAGSIRVKGMTLQPGFVNNLLLTDTLAFGLTGDGIAPFAWSVSNTSIATIDANGVLRPQALGFVRVLVTDSQGLRDSTNVFRIQPATLASLTISMPDTTTRQTRVLRMPVRTSDLTGIGATSFETIVVYPTTVLTFLGIDTVGTAIGGGQAPAVFQSADQIRVAYASDSPLSGAGELYALRFQVSPTFVGGVSLSFNQARFNEDLIPVLDNSSVNILAAPPIAITPNPVHTTPGRTVTLNVTGTGTAPYTFQIETAGIVSESNSTLTGLVRGLTRVRAVDAEGFPSPWAPVQVFDIEARLADTTVVYPDTMRLPLRVESLTGLGIRSVESIIRYDSTLFRWLGVETTALSAGMTIETERIGTDIRVALAETSDLSGSGDLLRFSFIPRSEIGNMVRMPLTLVRLRFNEASDSTATSQLFDGGLTNDWDWTAPSAPRDLVAVPEPGAGVRMRLSWVAPEDDGGRPLLGYLIQYKQATASEWTTFNGGNSPDTTLVVDGLMPETGYDFRIAARNEIGLGDFLTGATATDLDRTDDKVLQTALLGNYPNPFNPSTTIRFQLSVSGPARLEVYDMLGRRVAVLADGIHPSGMHSIVFDASNLASGVYLTRLDADGHLLSQTLLLVK